MVAVACDIRRVRRVVPVVAVACDIRRVRRVGVGLLMFAGGIVQGVVFGIEQGQHLSSSPVAAFFGVLYGV